MQCEHLVELLNVKPGNTQSNHVVLKW